MAISGIQTNIVAVQEAIKLYGLMVKNDADKGIRKKMGDIAFQAGANTYHTEKDKLQPQPPQYKPQSQPQQWQQH